MNRGTLAQILSGVMIYASGVNCGVAQFISRVCSWLTLKLGQHAGECGMPSGEKENKQTKREMPAFELIR
jgi:succinate-acetate transporter protein